MSLERLAFEVNPLKDRSGGKDSDIMTEVSFDGDSAKKIAEVLALYNEKSLECQRNRVGTVFSYQLYNEIYRGVYPLLEPNELFILSLKILEHFPPDVESDRAKLSQNLSYTKLQNLHSDFYSSFMRGFLMLSYKNSQNDFRLDAGNLRIVRFLDCLRADDGNAISLTVYGDLGDMVFNQIYGVNLHLQGSAGDEFCSDAVNCRVKADSVGAYNLGTYAKDSTFTFDRIIGTDLNYRHENYPNNCVFNVGDEASYSLLSDAIKSRTSEPTIQPFTDSLVNLVRT